ncbi:MAG: chorismate-binding protein [Polyangiales bacterium]
MLRATFPPGSITGAPKIAAIQIIERLEKHPRGVYCGAVGFVDRAGGCSFVVAIRTASVRNERYYWRAEGWVSASVPADEVAETELKAQVFLNALAT